MADYANVEPIEPAAFQQLVRDTFGRHAHVAGDAICESCGPCTVCGQEEARFATEDGSGRRIGWGCLRRAVGRSTSSTANEELRP